MQTTQSKNLPNSQESEMMVLGSAITNSYSSKLTVEMLSETDFFYVEHKTIFSSLKALFHSNTPIDVHLISTELKRQDRLEKIGGLPYIIKLAQFAGTSVYIEEYIQELKRFSAQRELINLAKTIEESAFGKADPIQITFDILQAIRKIEKFRNLKDRFPITFLSQFEQNFLLCEPTKKAMLLEYTNEKGSPIGFLPKGIVAMLVGAGGIGKTHLLAQLALSLATGKPFLDLFTTTHSCGKEKRGNVFFGLGENHYDDIHRILYKAAKKFRQEKEPQGLNLLQEASKRIAAFSFCGQQAAFLEGKQPSMYFRELKRRLEDLAPPDGWSLIILDPVSRLLGSDAELDNAAATQFIALLEELTIELPGNPTVLFAHHVNKSAIKDLSKQDQSAARGSSALTDGVRWQINFSKSSNEQEKSDNVAILKMTKSNFTAVMHEIKTIRDPDGFLNRYIPSSSIFSKGH